MQARPHGPASPDAQRKFGRYDLLESIGAGGMGEVFLAYDAQLHRKVAIKRLSRSVATAENARLLREARTLAQLSHPNLVHLYEVGEHEGEVYLAMEYIDGQSLSAWLAERRRGTQEVLDVFTAAGNGLAAAHRAGIVHRDFKPANVIIGADGIARVVDFGIAVLVDSLGDKAAFDDPRVRDRAAALRLTLTARGIVLGTPPYMAPEQLMGGRGDARSDQYAFAIALFEALFGCRPFPDERVASAAAKLRGELDIPRVDGVPRHLRAVLRRALASDVEARFDSMDALLAALAPTRSRRVWLGVAAGAAVGAIAYAWLAPSRAGSGCETPPASITSLWGEEQREAVRTAFSAVDADYAATSLRLVTAHLDSYVERWIDIWRSSCKATLVARTQSQELFDLRMACLDRGLNQLGATVEVLATADDHTIGNAADLMHRVSSIEPCVDDDALRDELPPPESAEQRARIEQVRGDLERVRAQIGAGRFANALDRAREVVAAADEIGYEPLRAEAYLALGGALEGAPAEAEAALRTAVVAAGKGRHDTVAARAAVDLVHIVGVTRARIAEAESLATNAEAAIARIGDVRMSADLAAVRGSLASADGRYEDAIAAFGDAESLLREVAGADDPRLRVFNNNLGVVLLLKGDLDKARAKFEEALAAGERSVGPDHPDIADYLMNLGNVLMERRDGVNAKRSFDRAMTLVTRDPAQNRRRIAMITSNVAFAETLLGELDAAERDARKAQQELTATLGARHPHIAGTLDVLAQVAWLRGDLEAAAEHVMAAESIITSALGNDHPLALVLRMRRAAIANDRGSSTESIVLLELTVASLRTTFGAEHPDLATATVTLAEARLSTDARAAATALRGALPRLRPLDHHVVGRAHYALALALWEASESRAEALEHAEVAVDELTKAGDAKADVVRQWIAARR